MRVEFVWPSNVVDWALAAVGAFFFCVGVVQFARWLIKRLTTRRDVDSMAGHPPRT